MASVQIIARHVFSSVNLARDAAMGNFTTSTTDVAFHVQTLDVRRATLEVVPLVPLGSAGPHTTEFLGVQNVCQIAFHAATTKLATHAKMGITLIRTEAAV